MEKNAITGSNKLILIGHMTLKITDQVPFISSFRQLTLTASFSIYSTELVSIKIKINV